jgi:hypothetical protein
MTKDSHLVNEAKEMLGTTCSVPTPLGSSSGIWVGPAQLAIAILADAHEDALLTSPYQRFNRGRFRSD